MLDVLVLRYIAYDLKIILDVKNTQYIRTQDITLLMFNHFKTSQVYTTASLLQLLCLRYGFDTVDVDTMTKNLNDMSKSIEVAISFQSKVSNDVYGTVDYIATNCCPKDEIINYKSQLKDVENEDKSIANIVLNSKPPEYLYTDTKADVEPFITQFYESAGVCDEKDRKYEFKNDYHYVDEFKSKLTKWLLFYFYHHSFARGDVDNNMINEFNYMSQPELFLDFSKPVSKTLIVGDIISRPIFAGMRHLGIYIGHMNNVPLIIDLDTDFRRCSRICIKTMFEFAGGKTVRKHKSIRIRKRRLPYPRLPLKATLMILYKSIGQTYKYRITKSDCDVFITNICFGRLVCNQNPTTYTLHTPYNIVHIPQ
jgi:hypothetical protein